METAKPKKILIFVTCVFLAMVIAAASAVGYHIAWNKDRFYPFHYKPEDIQVVTLSSLLLEGGPSRQGKSCTTYDPKVIKKIITILNGFSATSQKVGGAYSQPEPNTLQFLDNDGNLTIIHFRDDQVGVNDYNTYEDVFYYGGPKGYFQPLLDLLEEGFE